MYFGGESQARGALESQKWFCTLSTPLWKDRNEGGTNGACLRSGYKARFKDDIVGLPLAWLAARVHQRRTLFVHGRGLAIKIR